MSKVASGTEIVKYETENGDVTLSVDIVKTYIAKNELVTNGEAILFMKLCQFQRLNPFLREVYLIKYGNDPATMVVGKETFTKRAEKSPKYNGAESGIYTINGKNEVVQRNGAFYLPDETVVGAWAKVYRKGWDYPVNISVRLDEYIGRKKDGTPNRSWRERPATMIRKVALVQALREAFPDMFAGMYIEEEPQSSDELEATIKMPSSKEAPISKGLNEKEQDTEEIIGTVEVMPETDTPEPQVTEPSTKKEGDQLELKGDGNGEVDYFQAIVKKVNGMKEASRILPVMNKANKAKGNPVALKEIYESLEV